MIAVVLVADIPRFRHLIDLLLIKSWIYQTCWCVIVIVYPPPRVLVMFTLLSFKQYFKDLFFDNANYGSSVV